MIENRWEHFSHGADIGLRGIGADKAGAFEQAGVALTAAITDPALVAAVFSIHIECQAPDDEILLVDWLNALIYEMATRRMLFSRFRVALADDSLRAEVWGESVDVIKHQPGIEVKGATFTELRVGQNPDGSWFAQCVVDV